MQISSRSIKVRSQIYYSSPWNIKSKIESQWTLKDKVKHAFSAVFWAVLCQPQRTIFHNKNYDNYTLCLGLVLNIMIIFWASISYMACIDAWACRLLWIEWANEACITLDRSPDHPWQRTLLRRDYIVAARWQDAFYQITLTHLAHSFSYEKQEAFEKGWAHSPLLAAARRIAIHQVSPPAHRCPQQQRQRQRVTEGTTAMAP